MRSILTRIVWTAVVAAILAVTSVVLAFFGDETAAIVVALAGVTSALLASRDRR